MDGKKRKEEEKKEEREECWNLYLVWWIWVEHFEIGDKYLIVGREGKVVGRKR